MASPVSGLWAQLNASPNDYAGALKWGTGASSVYAQFGEGPPLGITGRNEDDIPYRPVPPSLLAPPGLEWGYTLEDMVPGNFAEFMETEFPEWTKRPEVTRGETASHHFPPPALMARPNGPSGTWLRSLTQPGLLDDATRPHMYPTETVTEGWEHKQHGVILDAAVSSRHQYERQTSMQQVNPAEGRNNKGAVERGTDEPRSNILTRLTGMKVKPWSEGQRLQDMFPYQQDLMLRPWWYRNAGTGPVQWMVTNEYNQVLPVQRQPPAEPDYGPNEDENIGSPDWGYTIEDAQYA